MELHHHHHHVNFSNRPLDVRGVAAAILHPQGPDGLSMLYLHHLEKHGMAFLTELFNLSVAGIDIPAVWKDSFIIPILQAGKPCEQGRSCLPYLAALPGRKDSGVAPPPYHCGGARNSPLPAKLQPMHFTSLSLLPISTGVVSGFNHRKPRSRTIAVVVDIS